VKRQVHSLARTPLMTFGLALLFLKVSSVPAWACTIFALTDADHALFFNNEDYSNPATRIWFVPGGEGCYGCAYVGFDNGWAQGGLNTKGLAFDWVAGFTEEWQPNDLKSVRGNPSERMLESCVTVEDATAFYRKYREPGFSYAKVFVADKNGVSTIIGAKNGKLQVEKTHRSRGFGYGGRTLERMLAEPPAPTVSGGIAILQACLQDGLYATKYSNVFDLKSGEIFLLPSPKQGEPVRLNLLAELEKGGHYYDIPKIQKQLTETARPLLTNMKRFPLGQYKSIPDKEPEVTAHIRRMLQNAAAGTMRSQDYAAELWKQLSGLQKQIQAELKTLGNLLSLSLVERKNDGPRRSYRYIMEFKNARVLQHFVFDEENRVSLSQSEGVEMKPTAGGEVGSDR
jgi:hypothetical protein